MRILIPVLIVLAVATGTVAADETMPNGCLSPKETREAVAQKLVVAPVAAIRAARAAAGGGRVVRADLCREGGGLSYQIIMLNRDGRVKRVAIDGASGRVGTIR